MAASAADVRSIFALPDQPPSAGPSQTPKSSAPAKKPDGISRELYALIGPSVPTLVQLAKPQLKQKPNLGGGGRSRWENRPFKNPGRTDGLELKHWVKVSADPEGEYRFAKYDIQSPVYSYTPEEYTNLLEDAEWSKDETDYLFKIVQKYDTRWYVIFDRYEFPDHTRTMEDLKDRYYSVCRKLIRNRPWDGDENAKNQLLSSFQFDKEREQTRKKYVASLENRTEEQVIEEEALFIELKRLEQNERNFKQDRDALLRTVVGIESGLLDITEDDAASLGITMDAKKKRKGLSALDLDSPMTPLSASLAAPSIKRPQSAKSAAQDAANCIIRFDYPANSTTTKSAHQPAYLRSFKVPVPKAAIAAKVIPALAELSISHSRLVMPTRDNCALFESLLEAVSALVETKRLVEKVEFDIQVMKNRLGMRESQGEGADGRAGSVMDVDEAEGADGRSQSVVSARSTRSRKHTRRSMSVSSADTTLSANKGTTKRQKRS